MFLAFACVNEFTVALKTCRVVKIGLFCSLAIVVKALPLFCNANPTRFGFRFRFELDTRRFGYARDNYGRYRSLACSFRVS